MFLSQIWLCVALLTLDDWHDGTLLNSRWALETVSVNSTEKLWLEVHGVEGVDSLIVVGLDLSCRHRVSSCSSDVARLEALCR